jgi:hypothetical protein
VHPKGDLSAPLHVQFAESVVNMRLCCRQTDIEPPGDFLVAQPAADETNNLKFAGRQQLRPRRISRRSYGRRRYPLQETGRNET